MAQLKYLNPGGLPRSILKSLPREGDMVNKWIVFPDAMSNPNTGAAGRFLGYITRDDITQLQGAFPVGQNITFTPAKTPTVRPGSQLIGTAINTDHKVMRAWVFERNDGVQIEMKTYDTGVYFLINGVMDDYQLLEGGYTADKEFCYAVIAKQGTDINSRCNWCNGVEDWRKWTGLYATYASDDGVNVITVSGDTDLDDLGFPASGAIGYKGIKITYSGLSGKTFTGCSAVPSTSGAAAGDILVDFPVIMSGNGIAPSSVAIAYDSRIFARQDSNKNTLLVSKINNPDDWTFTADQFIDGDGIIKLIEQGGPITAFANDENKLYIFKNRLIKTVEFIASGNLNQFPTFKTLKPSNDKSTTIGAIGQKSTFAGPNSIFFVTTDKQLLQIYRADFKDYPQQQDIADPIRPTFFAGVHDEATGVVYNSRIFYAYKQDSHSSYNDTVLIYDLVRGIWSMPIVGWNVNDWTIVDGKLRWHSSVSPNTYELTTDQLDNNFEFTTVLRTWQESFGSPHYQKKIGYAMLEIYLQDNSEVTATILYDENGFSGQDEIVLRGSDVRFKLGATKYNPFGANAFGEERFGSNPDLSGMNKYRFVWELKKNVEFYNVALQLSTQTANCNYELIRFGYYLTDIIQQPNPQYLIGADEVDNLNLN